jgi:hypothetical protein
MALFLRVSHRPAFADVSFPTEQRRISSVPARLVVLDLDEIQGQIILNLEDGRQGPGPKKNEDTNRRDK